MNPDQLATAVGARIRRLRKAADLTIEQLAEKAQVGTVYLGNVERGGENPSLKILGSVSVALGVSVAQLVDVDSDLSLKDVKREARVRLDKAAPEDVQTLLRVLRALRG